MTVLKNIILILLICSLSLSLFSCGENHYATGENNNKNPSGSGESDDDPTNDFTVQLMLGDKAFVPESAMKVYWNDGYNVHIADVDETGFAKVDGPGTYVMTVEYTEGMAFFTLEYTITVTE